MSIIKNLLYKKIKINRKPRALCFFFDGKFDSEFAQTLDIELFGNEDLSVYRWDKNLKNKNITIIRKEEIYQYPYDFIIFNSFSVFENHIMNLPKSLHIPSVVFQHEDLAMTNFHLKQKLAQARTELVITKDKLYGIENKTDIKKDIDILVAGLFQPADYPLIDKIKKQIPNLLVIGNNPGLSYSVPISDYNSYKELFYRSKIFINLTTQKSVNYEVLWALSGGAKVIGFKLNELKDIEKYISAFNNIEEIINCAKRELSNIDSPYQFPHLEELLKVFDMKKVKEIGSSIVNKYYNEVFKYE